MASCSRVNIGRKHDQPLNQAYRVNLAYRVAAEAADYLKVMLTADEGPLGTRDYQTLQAAGLVGGVLLRNRLL